MRQKILPVNSSVEVTSHDPGFFGSWYEATIISQSGKTYKIRYQNLMEVDMKTPCEEMVKMTLVRPLPPKIIDNSEAWLPGHAVEAYSSDGWWQGIIDCRLSEELFRVYFQYSSEVLDIPLENLRSRQDWNGQKWTAVTRLFPSANTNKVDINISSKPNLVTVNKFETNDSTTPPTGTYEYERKRGRSIASLVESQICSGHQEETILASTDLDSFPCKGKVMKIEDNDVKVLVNKNFGNHQQPVGLFSEVHQPCTPSECGQPRQRWYSHSGSIWTSPVQQKQSAIKESSGPTSSVARLAASRNTYTKGAVHAYEAVLRAFYAEGSALDLAKLKIMADLRISFNIPNSCHVALLRLLSDQTTGCSRGSDSVDDVLSSHQLDD